MKNNKAISLISLIVTIAVILILASVTIYYGLVKNTDQAVETKTVYEVHEIIDAVSSRALLNKLNSNYYTLIGKTTFEDITITQNNITTTYTSDNGWYLLDETSEFAALGLENVTGRYLIKYETCEVISIGGIVYNEKVYYSLNNLKKDMGGGTTVLSRVEYDANKGVNKPVLSKGMVPVKLSGGKWVVTNTEDESWYDYSKDQMAWANVMLMDELEVAGYDNETLRNTPISELSGLEVQTEGSAYVWIPRYTTTSVGSSGSKIIFSNLTKDITSANGESYVCPPAFTFNEGGESLDLTGIWVSKYEAGFAE